MSLKEQLAQKEQLRKALIGVAIGIVGLGLLYFFVLRPVGADTARLEGDIFETRQKLKSYRGLIEQKDDIRQEYEQEQEELRRIIRNRMVPPENPVAWVGSALRELAGEQGLTIRRLSGGGTYRPGEEKTAQLEYFVAEVEVAGGYHDFGRFLANAERRLPYAYLKRLSVTAQGRNERDATLRIAFSYSVPRFTEETFPLAERPGFSNDGIAPPETTSELQE